MPYNHAFLAKKLCDSNHDIISTFLLANKKKHIANYLSSCAEAGFATYDGTTGNLVDAEYLIYDEDNLTIRIEVANTLANKVRSMPAEGMMAAMAALNGAGVIAPSGIVGKVSVVRK